MKPDAQLNTTVIKPHSLIIYSKNKEKYVYPNNLGEDAQIVESNVADLYGSLSGAVKITEDQIAEFKESGLSIANAKVLKTFSLEGFTKLTQLDQMAMTELYLNRSKSLQKRTNNDFVKFCICLAVTSDTIKRGVKRKWYQQRLGYSEKTAQRLINIGKKLKSVSPDRVVGFTPSQLMRLSTLEQSSIDVVLDLESKPTVRQLEQIKKKETSILFDKDGKNRDLEEIQSRIENVLEKSTESSEIPELGIVVDENENNKPSKSKNVTNDAIKPKAKATGFEITLKKVLSLLINVETILQSLDAAEVQEEEDKVKCIQYIKTIVIKSDTIVQSVAHTRSRLLKTEEETNNE